MIKSAWRDSARFPSILGIDARILLPIAIWLFHWAWITLYIAVGGILFFFIIDRAGYTPEVAYRSLKRYIISGNRTVPNVKKYRFRCK